MQKIESDAIHLPLCVRQFSKLQIHQLVPLRSKGNSKGRRVHANSVAHLHRSFFSKASSLPRVQCDS